MASKALRFIALAEFAAALGAWGLGVLDWGLACGMERTDADRADEPRRPDGTVDSRWR